MKIWDMLIIKEAKVIFFNFLKKISSRKPKPRWSIVIDPGHGGRHPGAVNKRYNITEKLINLCVGWEMKKYVQDNIPELLALRTRKDDTYVSLRDRCRFANDWFEETANGRKKIDAFISIHTNARLLKGRYGLEIETFHFRGSEEGRALAYCIQDTLFNRSMKFGVSVIDRGVKIGQRRGKDGELKDFYVLRETHMPAVLVELGFLSDDEEAQLLIKPENQEIMAKAIIDGVVQWLEEKG